MNRETWDQRYSGPEWAYGVEPNDFLRSVVDRLPRGRALCLAEGQGRNAVFLASQGLDVTAMDQSRVGMEKAATLASERGLSIRTAVADLADYAIEPAAWDLVVLIWAHLPPALRERVHRTVVEGLRPGGAVVIEAYTPDQLKYGTGGPKDPSFTMTCDILRREFAGLEVDICRELVREVHEGNHHTGTGAVVQFLAHRAG